MLGERLAELRKDHGMTQVELANKLHLSATTISAYENDRSTPSDETKAKIARILGVSLDYLLGVLDEEAEPDRSTIVNLPYETPPEIVSEVRDYAGYLLDKHKRKR